MSSPQFVPVARRADERPLPDVVQGEEADHAADPGRRQTVDQLESALAGEGVQAVEQFEDDRPLSGTPTAMRLLEEQRFELAAEEPGAPAAGAHRDDRTVPDPPPVFERERVQSGSGGASDEEVVEDVVPGYFGSARP